MQGYVEHIIVPYIKNVRENVGNDKAALVIMDNFKGQVTESVLKLLDDHNILVVLLPPNTTDQLQPMDISVNKPAKEYLRKRFEEWYSMKVMKQLDDEDLDQLEGGQMYSLLT